MIVQGLIRPDFLVIGAQRAGTTWLWTMLKQHPGTSLPERKEIHFFGSAELYRGGKDWYYRHFQHLDPSKVVGEGSTTYLYDRMPHWHNDSHRLEFDASFSSIPELVAQELPQAKILIMLRDPVRRAISAYYFWMRHVNDIWRPFLGLKQPALRYPDIWPFLGLKQTALQYPKLRILEYGYYERYLKLWRAYIPSDRIRVFVFEDIVREPLKTVREVYEFLGLDPGFLPNAPDRVVHRSWTWTRIVFRYFANGVSPWVARSRLLGNWLDRHDFLGKLAVGADDIEFLRSHYLPEKPELERLLNRPLDCWRYGREPSER